MEEIQTMKSRVGNLWRADEGKLIEWTPTQLRVTRYWPLPRCWERDQAKGSKWREVFGKVPISDVQPEFGRAFKQQRYQNLQSAWESVPAEVRQAVRRCTVGTERWALLQLVARCPGALELAHSVPLLAGALSVSNHIRVGKRVARPLRSARALLRPADGMKRWLGIAAWLGFEASPSFIKVLRRISTANGWEIGLFGQLVRIWKHPLGQKRLRHLPNLDSGVVELLSLGMVDDLLDQIEYPLFQAAFTEGGWGGVASTFANGLEAWTAMRGSHPIPRWRTPEAIEASIAMLRDEARQLIGMAPVSPTGPLPPPPWPESAGFEALDSQAAIELEGRRMHHCIGNGDWAREARALGGYGYVVTLNNERATLWIRRSPHDPNRFIPIQFRGPHNCSPSDAMIERVSYWVAGHNSAVADGPRGGRTLPPPWNAPWPVVREGEFPRAILDLAGHLNDDDIPF